MKETQDAYNEWAIAQGKINDLKELQKACIETAANLLDTNKSDVSWAFKTRFEDKKEEVDIKNDDREVVYGKIFSP